MDEKSVAWAHLDSLPQARRIQVVWLDDEAADERVQTYDRFDVEADPAGDPRFGIVDSHLAHPCRGEIVAIVNAVVESSIDGDVPPVSYTHLTLPTNREV